MTEHELQNQIQVVLSYYGRVARANSGVFYQGNRRGNILTDIYAVRGMPAGFPDLMLIGKNGLTAFVEVKTPTGQVRENQKNSWIFCIRIVTGSAWRGR